MKSIYLLALLGIVLALVSGCIFDATPELKPKTDQPVNATPTPIPTPVPTDTEIVKAGIGNYFMPTHTYYGRFTYGGIIEENPALLTLANENAKKGIHSVKIIGKTPEEAIATFMVYDKGWHSKTAFFNIVNTQPALPAYAPAYAMGIHKSGNQYSICVVASKHVESTVNKTATGAYELVEYPDEILYVW